MRESSMKKKRIKYMNKYADLFAKKIPDMTIREKAHLMKFYSMFEVEELYNISPKHFNKAIDLYDDLNKFSYYNVEHKRYVGFIARNLKNTLEDYKNSIAAANDGDFKLFVLFLFKCSLLLVAEVVCMPVTIPLQIIQGIKNRINTPLKDTKAFANKMKSYLSTHKIPTTWTQIDERHLEQTQTVENQYASRNPKVIKDVFTTKKQTHTQEDMFETKQDSYNDLISQSFDQNAVSMKDASVPQDDFELPNIDIK